MEQIELFIIQHLIESLGVSGTIASIIFYFIIKKKINFKKLYFKNLQPNFKLKNHTVFTGHEEMHRWINNIEVENKLNEKLFKILLHKKNDAITEELQILVDNYQKKKKIELKDAMDKVLSKIVRSYHKKFKETIFVKYETKKGFKKLVELAKINSDFVDKLSTYEIENRLEQIVKIIIDKFENEHEENVKLLLLNVNDLSNAYKKKVDRVDGFMNECRGAMLDAKKDVIKVLYNTNGDIKKYLTK